MNRTAIQTVSRKNLTYYERGGASSVVFNGSSAPSSLPEVVAWRFVTDDSQVVTDNGDTGLNLAITDYRYPNEYSTDNPVTVIPQPGIYSCSIGIRLALATMSSYKVRCRLLFDVIRDSSVIDSVLINEVYTSQYDHQHNDDYNGYIEMLTGACDFALEEGDTLMPVLSISGLATGDEVYYSGYWAGHRVGVV